MDMTELHAYANKAHENRKARIYSAMVNLVRESINKEPLNGALISVSAVKTADGIQIDAVVKISEFIAD